MLYCYNSLNILNPIRYNLVADFKNSLQHFARASATWNKGTRLSSSIRKEGQRHKYIVFVLSGKLLLSFDQ